MRKWCVVGLAVVVMACGDGVSVGRWGSPSIGAERVRDHVASRPELQRVVEAVDEADLAALRGFFADPDPAVRARAAFGAASLRDSSLARPLLRLLDDPSSAVRSDAAFALSGLGPSAEVERALVARLATEEDPGVVVTVTRALGFVGGSEASRALATGAPAERLAQTRALARLAARSALAPEIRDTLADRLRHVDAGVREAAARGLAASNGPDVWILYRNAIADALTAYDVDDGAARPLLGAFGRLLPRPDLVRWVVLPADPRTRLAAVRALASHSDGLGGIDDLAGALADPHPWVRQAAALGLAGFATSGRAFQALEGVVTPESDPATEEAWLRALASLGRFDEIAARVRGRPLDDVVGWSAATTILSGTDDPALAALLARASASPSPYVRALVDRARGGGAAGPTHGAPDSVVSAPEPSWTPADWAYLAALGPDPHLVMEFDGGRVVVRLDPEQAPATVRYLARRVEAGAYDGVPVHRVLSGALVQLGSLDPTGPGPRRELGRLSFRRGVVGWASGAGHSDDDFFVGLDDLPELDGEYTAFGWVVEGLDVIERLRPGELVRAAVVEPG